MRKATQGEFRKKTSQAKRQAGKMQGTEIILQEKTRELQERVKELDCLYGISRFIEKPGISIPEILQGAADALPSAWQYPDIACARILFDTLIVTSRKFRETPGSSRNPSKSGGTSSAEWMSSILRILLSAMKGVFFGKRGTSSMRLPNV